MMLVLKKPETREEVPEHWSKLNAQVIYVSKSDDLLLTSDQALDLELNQ